MLITGLSAGALAGCDPSGPAPVTSSAVYTNDFYVPGVGYYHAPHRAFFAYPYNHFDPQKNEYYFGGQWSSLPGESITNISSPLTNVAVFAENQRSDVSRGGFGCTSGGGYFSGG